MKKFLRQVLIGKCMEKSNQVMKNELGKKIYEKVIRKLFLHESSIFRNLAEHIFTFFIARLRSFDLAIWKIQKPFLFAKQIRLLGLKFAFITV